MRWHYTTGQKVGLIFADRYIKPATAGVPRDERPIVWFTTSAAWEETANKGVMSTTGEVIRLTREQTELAGGLFRFGVADDFPLHSFWRITRESKQDPRVTEELIESAVRWGSNPERDWWGTFHRVESAHWKTIELSTPDGWRNFKDHVTVEIYPDGSLKMLKK